MEYGEKAAALTAIVITGLLFTISYYVNKKKLLLKYLIMPLFPGSSPEVADFVAGKSTGILFTGIIPVIYFLIILGYKPPSAGLVVGDTLKFWYLILLLIVITVIVSFITSKDKAIMERSPELKLRDWYPRHVLLSAAFWTIYILGYEFLFRGVLWFLSSEAFGFWIALVINLTLYSVVHLPQGRLMAAGSVPVGVVLCLLSHLTGSFIPAFLIHSFIALSTDLFSIYHNRDIHLHPFITGK